MSFHHHHDLRAPRNTREKIAKSASRPLSWFRSRLVFRKRNNGRSEAKVHCFLATPSIPWDASLLKLRHEFLNSIFHFRALCSALVPSRFQDASVTLNPFKPSWALPSYVSLLQRTRESVFYFLGLASSFFPAGFIHEEASVKKVKGSFFSIFPDGFMFVLVSLTHIPDMGSRQFRQKRGD